MEGLNLFADHPVHTEFRDGSSTVLVVEGENKFILVQGISSTRIVAQNGDAILFRQGRTFPYILAGSLGFSKKFSLFQVVFRIAL